jgi:hypothetical protein
MGCFVPRSPRPRACSRRPLRTSLRRLLDTKSIAMAAAKSEDISHEPGVREATDCPDYYLPTKDRQGWVFSWPKQPEPDAPAP